MMSASNRSGVCRYFAVKVDLCIRSLLLGVVGSTD